MEKQIQIQKWIQSNWPKRRYAFHFMRRPPWCLLRFDVVSSGMLPWPFDEFGGHKLVVTWLFFPCVLLWLHMFLLGDDFSNHSQNLPFPSSVYLEAWVPAHYNFPRSKFLDICRHSRTISKHFFLSTTIGQYVLVQVTLQLVADLCSLYFQTHYIILSYTTHNRDSGSDCKNCISDRKKWCKLK